MSPDIRRLAGRTALVTGSTGGLGVAIASALAAEGAFVVVSGRDKARGDAVVADIRSAGGTAEFVVADLGAGEHEVRRLAERATAVAGGRIDILVNNAAMLLMPTPTAEISEELLRDAFAVNVFAPFLLTGALAPAMVERGEGAIVNIGSITGLRGGDGVRDLQRQQGGDPLVHSVVGRRIRAVRRAGERRRAGTHRDRTPGTVRRSRRAGAGPYPVAADEHTGRGGGGGGISGQRRRRQHSRRCVERGRGLGGHLTHGLDFVA